jgi:hypothetical protein
MCASATQWLEVEKQRMDAMVVVKEADAPGCRRLRDLRARRPDCHRPARH